MCLVLNSFASASSDEIFLEDLIVNFELHAPTVIFDEELPEFCMTIERVLCLKHDAPGIAQHLKMLHLSRKQDGVLFAEGEGMAILVKEVARLIPSLFRSPCPAFMSLDYADLIDLKLDSNIIFYKREADLEYILLDKFAVKGGQPITLELGSWTKKGGLELYASKYRWNRRTDLKGAVLINTFKYYKNFAHPLYDGQGNLIGSEGSRPDRVYAFADRLNVTIKDLLTFDGEFGRKLENGTWTGCVGMLTKNHADLCTAGLAWTFIRNTAIDYTDSLKVPLAGYTLIGQSRRERILDMWAYLGVFGLAEWLILAGLLLIISLILFMTYSSIHVEESSLFERAGLGFSTVYLYFIQLGEHPEGGSTAWRLLHLTTALLTFMMFAYYTTVITAEMTSTASQANPIRTFADVLEFKDIEVIVVKGSSWTSQMARSAPGTPKAMVYKNRIENNGQAWYTSLKDAKDAVLSNPKAYLYGHVSVAKSTPGLMALRMLDSNRVSGGIGLQKDSELLAIVNYQMLKLAEGGIIQRIDKKWPDTSRNEEFGMAEPAPLSFNNILFPFTLLATGIATAVVLACLEYILTRASTNKSIIKQ